MPVTWVDDVTPVNAANLEIMEADTAEAKTTADAAQAAADLKVAKDAVEAASARLVAAKLVGGDANESFKILGSGQILWGAGGATVLDTNLYRSGANQLKTDDALRVVGDFIANAGGAGQLWANSGGTLYFGTALDTSLYRYGADQLGTTSQLRLLDPLGITFGDASNPMTRALLALGLAAGNTLLASRLAAADTTNAFLIRGDGRFDWGAGGSTAADTNLYRAAAGTLKTDNLFQSAGAVVGTAGADQVQIGANYIWFSNAYDTNLYRAAAGSLKTDGYLTTGQSFYVAPGGVTAIQLSSDGRIYFGVAADTNLYRSAAGTLKTDGAFFANGGIYTDGGLVVDNNSSGDKLYFGSALDTNLYRAAADILQTDDEFRATGIIRALSTGAAFVSNSDATQAYTAYGAAAKTLLRNLLSGADPQASFAIRGDGQMNWGVGGSTAPDTNLYRSAADTLKTDDKFSVGTFLTLDPALGLLGGGNVDFRGTSDVYVSAQGASGKVTIRNLTTGYQAQVTDRGLVSAQGGFASAQYGTALPASPVDGQEYTLVDSTTNPSYQWRFRYNASNSSSYKWEFIGGSDFYAMIATSESTSSAPYVDLATVGPQFTVPRAGYYHVEWGFGSAGSNPGSAMQSTVLGFTTGVTITAANYGQYTYMKRLSAALTASQLIKIQYGVTFGGSVVFSDRHLTVRPLKVS